MKFAKSILVALLGVAPLFAFVHPSSGSNGVQSTHTQASFFLKGFSYGPNNEELNFYEPGRSGCSRTEEMFIEINYLLYRTFFVDGPTNCTFVGDSAVYGETYEGGDQSAYIIYDDTTYIAGTVAGDGIEKLDFIAPAGDTVHLQAMPRTGYTFLYWRAYYSESLSSYSTQYNSASLAVPMSDLNGLWLYAEYKKNTF